MLTLHEQLRAETAALHRRLDSDSELAQLMWPDLTEEQLAGILLKMYRLYAVWQEQFCTYTQRFPLPTQYHIALHTQTLAGQLGLTGGSLPAGLPLLSLTSPEDYLGCAYVLNGSALGNRYILRKLANNPDIPEHSLTYFRTIEKAGMTPDRWQQWMVSLAHYCEKEGLDCQQLSASATHCFRALLTWFSSPENVQARDNSKHAQA